jgi:hypothetical protein
MADEWVKIRVLLPDDPKTIRVAKLLADDPGFQNWLGVSPARLPRDVIISVTVTALLKIWAVANSRGFRDGDDVLLQHADFAWLDETGRVPGLAAALDQVGWAHLDELDGVSAVRLPNFVEYNTPEEARSEKERTAREKNRERQRRFRQRQKGSNGQATLHNAPRAEQSREEQIREESATATAIDNRGVQGGKKGLDQTRAGIPAPPAQEKITAKPQAKFRGQPVPIGYQQTLDAIIGILQVHEFNPFEQRPDFVDQVGFLAKLAYADASGFAWPPDTEGRARSLWDLLGKAKRKQSPAAYLTTVLQEDLGTLWPVFRDELPSPAHCQWLLGMLARGELKEGS